MSSDLESNFLLGAGLSSLAGGTLVGALDSYQRGTSITNFTDVKAQRIALYTLPFLGAFVTTWIGGGLTNLLREPMGTLTSIAGIVAMAVSSKVFANRLHDYKDPIELQTIRKEAGKLSFTELRKSYGLDKITQHDLISSSELQKKFLNQYKGSYLTSIVKDLSLQQIEKYELLSKEEIREKFQKEFVEKRLSFFQVTNSFSFAEISNYALLEHRDLAALFASDLESFGVSHIKTYPLVQLKNYGVITEEVYRELFSMSSYLDDLVSIKENALLLAEVRYPNRTEKRLLRLLKEEFEIPDKVAAYQDRIRREIAIEMKEKAMAESEWHGNYFRYEKEADNADQTAHSVAYQMARTYENELYQRLFNEKNNVAHIMLADFEQGAYEREIEEAEQAFLRERKEIDSNLKYLGTCILSSL